MENANYSVETQKFIEEFITLSSKKNLQTGNEQMMHSALFYEKFRTAVEYQEDHLIFKNAVSRIIRRKYALSFSVSAESLYNDLIDELAWADYINPEVLTHVEVSRIKETINRYITLIHSVRPSVFKQYDHQKIIIGWMAAEIDEILYNHRRQELIIEFAYQSIKDNLRSNVPEIFRRESELQLKLAIITLLFKPDYSYVQYWVAKKIYPDFNNFTLEKAREIGSHFEEFLYKIEKVFNSPFKRDYLIYVKKNLAPFLLIKELPNYQNNLELYKSQPQVLHIWLMDIYDHQVLRARDKVWRGTIRALIFILITKISLALLLEIPYDRLFQDGISYFPLFINILVPPALMFFSGLSIVRPSLKNREVVSDMVNNLIFYQRVDNKPFFINPRRKSGVELFFDFLYFILNIAILFAVVYFLDKIGFNALSIILFFFFVSAVSFFSFRIRNIALELSAHRLRENFFISTIEFLFLPFVQIGKILSAAISKTNPFILTLDFLIEAPLKSIIKLTNSWLRFIKQKKEDIDV